MSARERLDQIEKEIKENLQNREFDEAERLSKDMLQVADGSGDFLKNGSDCTSADHGVTVCNTVSNNSITLMQPQAWSTKIARHAIAIGYITFGTMASLVFVYFGFVLKVIEIWPQTYANFTPAARQFFISHLLGLPITNPLYAAGIGIYALCILGAYTYAAWCLAAEKHPKLTTVFAILNCLCFPLGTVLGIVTLVVLSQEALSNRLALGLNAQVENKLEKHAK